MEWKKQSPPWLAAEGIMEVFVRKDGLKVIVTPFVQYANGQKWRHISMSREKRMPLYQDMCDVKEEFCGPDNMAIQVFPQSRHHVNIHNFCLHLWQPFLSNYIPEFSLGLGTI